MAHLVATDTLVDAWIGGALHILENGPTLNLLLDVTSPDRVGASRFVSERIDQFLLDAKEVPSHTVAETIFPALEYRRHGIRGVFDVYPDEIYPEIKRHPKIRWGTYAYRIVRRKRIGGQTFNPLKRIVDTMRQELASHATMPSRYELGISDVNFDLPIYGQSADGTRRIGAPCLSHLSFKLLGGAVHLTAFYRSHDYSFKVYGNLLGLARLQAGVATETEQRMGTLAVHSSYAYANRQKRALRSCIEDVQSALSPSGEDDAVAS